MSISDVMIHINEALSEEARSSLEDEIRSINGVVSPRFSPNKAQLMIVAFDPAVTSSAALLDKTRAAGYTAQLIGA